MLPAQAACLMMVDGADLMMNKGNTVVLSAFQSACFTAAYSCAGEWRQHGGEGGLQLQPV